MSKIRKTISKLTEPEKIPGSCKTIINLLIDKKGEDIVLFDIASLVVYTDYFIIATGKNFSHVQAMADSVVKSLKDIGIKYAIEGYSTASWILIDAGEALVHLFQTDARKFYNLEDLWSDAPGMEIDSSTEFK